MRGLLALVCLAGLAAGQELDAAAYAKWRRFISPKKEETRWSAIAWRPSLWVAVVEANRLRKPILLWAMNGHPFGMT